MVRMIHRWLCFPNRFQGEVQHTGQAQKVRMISIPEKGGQQTGGLSRWVFYQEDKKQTGKWASFHRSSQQAEEHLQVCLRYIYCSEIIPSVMLCSSEDQIFNAALQTHRANQRNLPQLCSIRLLQDCPNMEHKKWKKLWLVNFLFFTMIYIIFWQ